MSDNENSMLWGKSTWILFHTMAARISEDAYPKLYLQLLSIVKNICSNLPCPHCREHAVAWMIRVKSSGITNKDLFISMLYQFHNSVNARTGKPQFKHKSLEQYKKNNLGIALQNFLTFFARRYNGTIQAGIQSTEIKRRRIAISVKDWIERNWTSFR